MIPKEQLHKLKPLQDQVNRERQVRQKRTISFRKGRLTKRARQFALYPPQPKGTSDPKGTKWKGQKPMNERKKKVIKTPKKIKNLIDIEIKKSMSERKK